jgi:hypothetical protein
MGHAVTEALIQIKAARAYGGHRALSTSAPGRLTASPAGCIRASAKTGAVTLILRFGGALNLNLNVHFTHAVSGRGV